MGLGLSQYVPAVAYVSGLLFAALSIVVNPAIGVLFLFPILPYQNLFEKIKIFPLGKELNDILFLSILVGFWLKNFQRQNQRNEQKEHTSITKPVVLLAIVTFIGFINSTLTAGIPFGMDNKYLIDWKNYMLLPLAWFLTFKNIKNKKTLIILTTLMVLGIIGASYYFYGELRWMRLWHYSNRMRNTMTGLFVYLGANHYGAFFAHFVFILIGLLLFETTKIRKIILGGGIILTCYCLLYTYSRGAYLALISGLVFIGLVKERRMLVFLFLILIFWRSIVPISVKERVEMTHMEEGGLEHSAALRIKLWDVAWIMFRESPIIGKGFNTFNVEIDGKKWIDTHNFYMKMLAELGITGLSAFLYLLFSAFKTSWKLYRESNDKFFKGLGFGFATCVISAAITNFFGDRWSYLCLGSYFWVFLGIITRARIMNQAKVKLAKEARR